MALSQTDHRLFDLRWQRSHADLLQPLGSLYGATPEFEARLKEHLLARWSERPAELKEIGRAHV